MAELDSPNCSEHDKTSCCGELTIINSKDDFDLECTMCGDCDECEDCKEKVICVMPCDHQITYSFLKKKKVDQKNPLCCQCARNCKFQRTLPEPKCCSPQQSRACPRKSWSQQYSRSEKPKCMSAEIQCNISNEILNQRKKSMSPMDSIFKMKNIFSPSYPTEDNRMDDMNFMGNNGMENAYPMNDNIMNGAYPMQMEERFSGQSNRMSGAYPMQMEERCSGQSNKICGICPMQSYRSSKQSNRMSGLCPLQGSRMCAVCPMQSNRMGGLSPMQINGMSGCCSKRKNRGGGLCSFQNNMEDFNPMEFCKMGKMRKRKMTSQEKQARDLRSYMRFLERKLAHFEHAKKYVVNELNVIDYKSDENRCTWEQRIDAARIHLMVLLKKLIRYKMQLKERFNCVNEMREKEFGTVPQHCGCFKKNENKLDGNEIPKTESLKNNENVLNEPSPYVEIPFDMAEKKSPQESRLLSEMQMQNQQQGSRLVSEMRMQSQPPEARLLSEIRMHENRIKQLENANAALTQEIKMLKNI